MIETYAMKKSIRDKQKLILKILLSCHQFSVMMVKIHRKRSSKLKVEVVSKIQFLETAYVVNSNVIVLTSFVKARIRLAKEDRQPPRMT